MLVPVFTTFSASTEFCTILSSLQSTKIDYVILYIYK